MKICSIEEMLELGKAVASKLKLPAVIELVGDVGVGKTTFTQGLAEGLGIEGEVTSPSFTISKRYALPKNIGELIHYDFYRLSDPGLMRSELTESLNQPNSVVVIEWGGDVSDLLPKHKVRLDIKLTEDGSREVMINNPPQGLWKTCGKPVEKTQEKVEKIQKNVDKMSETCGKQVEKAKASEKNLRIIHSESKKAPSNTTVKLYLDTSTDVCLLRINDHEYTRVGKYDLAEKILTFIHEKLLIHHADWQDVTEITFFSGPGSFTGLRIGATIVNALADQLKIPLFDHFGKQHQIILPQYGREANISTPRK